MRMNRNSISSLILTILFCFVSTIFADMCDSLWDAVCQADSSRIKTYIKNGANINCRDSQDLLYEPLLHYAVEKKNIAIVKFLIMNGADINICDKNGKTALHLAAKKNNIDIAKYLIAAGANIDARDSAGALPVHWAAYSCNAQLIACFSQIKPDILKESDYNGNTLLHYAGLGYEVHDLKTFFTTVQSLIRSGANVNAKNHDGNTVLIFAVANTGSPENAWYNCDKYLPSIIAELVKYGADVSIKNNRGKSAYWFALIDSFPETKATLLASGKDFSDEEKDFKRMRMRDSREQLRADIGEFGEKFHENVIEDLPGSALAIGLPLSYLGLSLYTREHSYKDNKGDNWMNNINPFLSLTCTGALTGFLLGIASSRSLGGGGSPGIAAAGSYVLIFWTVAGTVVGAIAGAIVASKKPENPVLYYLAPIEVSISIPIIYFLSK
jgi:ankyrin repeat protein